MVDRPRLYAQLDRWREVRALLIQAPSGYGKSSLVSRWLDVAGLADRTAWLNLDEGDADPLRFIETAAASLEALCPGVAPLAHSLLDDSQRDLTQGWRKVIASLHACVPAKAADPHALLVLDDLHRAQSPAIDELLQTLLEQGPPALHVVMLTRRRTGLRLARFHAHEEIIHLTADDLRFNPEDVAAFLTAKGFAGATAADAEALTARSEGWITGLQLGVLSLRRPGDVGELLGALRGDHDWLADYLAGEALDRQTPALQRFLLETSILDEFTEALCRAVTGDPRAYAQLAALKQADLFLISLDAGGDWYRYHHLFQELLQHRLKSEADPERLAGLHRAAARWLADVGRIEAAVRHSLAAGDEVAAADLVEAQQSYALLHDLRRARQLFDLLPESVTQTRVRLMLDRTFVAIAAGELNLPLIVQQAGETIAQHAKESAETVTVRGEWSILRSALDYLEQDHEAAIRHLEQAGPSVATVPHHVAGLYWFLQMHLKLWADNYGPAQACGDRALAAFARSGFVLGTIAVQRELGHWSIRRGDSAAAQRHFHALLEGWQREQLHPIHDITFTYILAAENAYLRDELDQALDYQQRARQFARQLQDEELILLTEAMERGYQVLTDRSAIEPPAQLDALKPFVSFRYSEIFLDLETRRLVVTGQGEAGWSLVQTFGVTFTGNAQEYAQDGLIPYLRAYLARGRNLADISPLLHEATAHCAAQGMRLRQLQLLAFTAWQQLQLHGPAQALAPLAEASALAQATGYVRVLLDIPELEPLLARDELSSAPEASPVFKEESVIQFTQNEQQVLELLAADLTYSEIAHTLTVSINTVRYYIRSIYRKLSVHRRTSAILRARELGLLPSKVAAS